MLRNSKTTVHLIIKNLTLNNQKRSAGHSKWQNIRHTKALKDGQRSAMFTKLARQMKVAIQDGGSVDPKRNIKLEQVIEQAKRYNMPTATIQGILKSTQTKKDNCRKYILEIKGPGGCAMLCELYTENLTQTKMAVATILRKNSSKFADGGIRYLFHEKAVIEAKHPEFSGNKSEEETRERIVEDAIRFEAEDAVICEGERGDVYRFVCEPNALKQLEDNLIAEGYVIESSSVDFVPIRLQSVDDRDLEVCAALCEKLEGLSEVVRVYDNIA